MSHPIPSTPDRPASMGDYRSLRSRITDAAEFANRRVAPEPDGTSRMAVTIFDGGNFPTCTPCVYLGNPTETDADDTEGAAPTFSADTGQPVPVVVLNKAPSVGDILMAHNVGGRWVAEKGGTPTTPCFSGICGATVIFGPCPLDHYLYGNPPGPQPASGWPIVDPNDGGITGVYFKNEGNYQNCVPTVNFGTGASGDGSGATGYAVMANSGCNLQCTVDNPSFGYSLSDIPKVTISGGRFLPGGALPQSATATISGGEVVNPQVTFGGSGYPPISVVGLAFSAPPPGGTQAQGYAATDTNGVVNEIVITNSGQFYDDTTPLTLTIDPPPAGQKNSQQATATAQVTSIGVGAVTLSDPGYLVYEAPTLTIDAAVPGPGQATAHATLQSPDNWQVGSVTMTAKGSGYLSTDGSPCYLLLTITGSGGTSYGPFKVQFGVLHTTLAVPGGEGCPPADAPLDVLIAADDHQNATAQMFLGYSDTNSFACPPTTKNYVAVQVGQYANGKYYPPGSCVSYPACGPDNSKVYDDLGNCQNSVNVCTCMNGSCAGTNPGNFALGFNLPPCTSRPYSGSVTITITPELVLSGDSSFGAWYQAAGGDCSESGTCGGPTITFTISEP